MEALARSDSASAVAESRCCCPAVRASSTRRAAVSWAPASVASASVRAPSSSSVFSLAAVSRSSCDSARRRRRVVLRLGAELVALGPGGLDLLVPGALGGPHQERGLLVGVDDDRGRLLGGAGEHLLGLLAGPAGLGAVALGLDLQQAGLLTQGGEVGREALGLLACLPDQLVGHLLGTCQQGRRGRRLAGSSRGGVLSHPHTPLLTLTEGPVSQSRRPS